MSWGFVLTEKYRLHVLEVKVRGVWRNSKASRGHQNEGHVWLSGSSREVGRTIAGKVDSVFEETGPRHSSSLLVQGFLYAKHVR